MPADATGVVRGERVRVPGASAYVESDDPFDRLIVADALVAGATLVTKDRTIHDHTTIARW